MLFIGNDEYFDKAFIDAVVRGVVELQYAKKATMTCSILNLEERLVYALLVLCRAVAVDQLLSHLLLQIGSRAL